MEGGSPFDASHHSHSPLEVEQDKDLTELFALLDAHPPVIPDSLMEYYMTKAGVVCDDHRLKRLVALIGQKFITDIINDTMHFHRLRAGGGTAGRATGKRATLTLEDLAAALAEYGINVRRPPYHT